jgi:hypothetical protein
LVSIWKAFYGSVVARDDLRIDDDIIVWRPADGDSILDKSMGYGRISGYGDL